MRAGRWQGGGRGKEAEDDGIETGWLPHFYFSAMIQICMRGKKKNTQRNAEMIWNVTQAFSIMLKFNFSIT